MSMTVGELNVLMAADYTQMMQGFKQAEVAGTQAAQKIERNWEQTSQKLQAVGSKMTMFVTAPIIGVGVAAVKMASDMEETTNKVDVAFGDSAAVVKNWSKTSIESMGMAAQTALDSAALYGDMATGMGMSQESAAGLSMNMVQLAGDLASFKNIQIDVAKTALAGVFTGETESLKQLGIVMTEANLKQYALSQGLSDNIDQMTQAEKVQLRYGYILSVTGNAQGDFARTSEGAANQMRIAKERVKELGANIGNLLLPMAVDLLKWVNKLVQGFTDLPDSQKKTIITVAAVVAAIGPAIKVFGLLEKSTKVSQAIFNAFSANGFIGSMFASTAATTTFTAAENTAAVGGANMAAGTTAAAAGTAVAGTTAAAATPAVATFGTTMAAALGPITLIVAAAAVLIPLINSMGEETETTGTRIRDLNEDLKSMQEEIEASNKAMTDGVADINGNATAAKNLSDELYRLDGITNKTTAEKVKMKAIVKQLNALYPELGLEISDVNDELNKTKTSTDSLINSMKQQAIVAAYMEDWVRLTKQQTDQQTKLAEAQAAGAAATKELADYTNSLNETSYVNQVTMGMLQAQVEGAIEAEAGWKDELEKTGVALETVNGIIDGHTQTIAAATDANVLAAQTDEETLKAREDAAAEFAKNMESLTEEHYAQMGDIDQQGIKQSNLSAEQVRKNRAKQLDDWNAWASNIRSLAGKITPDVLAELEKLGPGEARMIKDLVNMNDYERSVWEGAWKSTSAAAKDQALWELNGMIPGAQSVVSGVTGVFTSSSNISSITNAASNIGIYGSQAMAAGAASKTEYVQATAVGVGLQLTGGLESGIIAGTYKPKDAASSLAVGVLHKFDNMHNEGISIGESFDDGMAEGISNKTWRVKNAAYAVGAAAVAAAKRATGSHSPSKKMEQEGFNFDAGLAGGIEKNMNLPVSAVERMAAVSMAALRSNTVSNTTSAVYNQQRYITNNIGQMGGGTASGQRTLWTFENAIGMAVA